MSTKLGLLLVAGVCLFVASAKISSAQGLPLAGNPTTLSAGAFFPNGGNAQHYGGSTQLYVEARYGFPANIPDTPTRTVVSVAGEFGNSNGGHSTIIPVTIGEYFGASGRSPFAPKNFYAGLGIGVYAESISGYANAGRFGGYGTVGYNVGAGFFVDAKYQVVEHGNGTLVGVGFRF